MTYNDVEKAPWESTAMTVYANHSGDNHTLPIEVHIFNQTVDDRLRPVTLATSKRDETFGSADSS